MHVCVKTGPSHEISTDTNHHDDENRYQQRFLTIEGIRIDAVYPSKGVLNMLIFFQELRQIGQTEQSRTKDGKGSKQSEILQEVSLDKDQTSKRADSCQTTQPYGLHLISQHRLRVAHILLMG